MDGSFLFFVFVGFAAQIVDGAIGMAFGVVSTSVLLAAGVAPAPASAAVHVAKVVTGAASGLAHLGFGNVDRALCRRLALPGIAGGVVGAVAISILPGDVVKPVIAVYLAVIGVVLAMRALSHAPPALPVPRPATVGLVGGFVDSLGGGWGPLVTSTLMAGGYEPKRVVGSANLAEFFVSLATAATFIALIGVAQWQVVLGLVVGGTAAAPVAAYACRFIPAQALQLLVGAVVIGLSARTFYLAFGSIAPAGVAPAGVG